MVEVAKAPKKTAAKGAKSVKPEILAEGGATPPKASSELVRVPAHIAEMLKAIEQHRLNGWNTVPKILNDPECPLADWLRPLYDRVIEEKTARADEMRNPKS